MDLVYLWQGKLYLKQGDKPPRQIESEFGRDIMQAALEIHRKHEWKSSGRGARFMSGGMLWGTGDVDPEAMPVNISAVTRGAAPGQLLYAVETNRVGGLFLYDCATGKEQRLFHREHFRVRDLARHPELPLSACSIPSATNTASIAIIPDERPFLEEVTSGESLDEAPAWIPGEGKQLVFQSAGIARNEQGHFHGVGPYAIHRIDLDTGHLETLLEDERHDLLLPRMDSAGNLYFIRRPYETGPKPALTAVLLDVVLFPFRLLYAVIHFFNFFSMMFSQKPLITAGGPKREGPEMRAIMLHGKMLDARQALRASSERPDAPGLVPRSWQLVRRSPDGTETVLAHAVVAYDLVQERPVYTNGRCIYSIDENLQKHLILKGQWVESLLVLAP